MKNWKRIAALAMSAVMVGGMLTGCGGGGGSTEAAKDNAPKAEAGAEAGKDEGEASADSGEKKQVYVFIRDRGDLSYWDSMAAGGDRSVTDWTGRMCMWWRPQPTFRQTCRPCTRLPTRALT